MNDEINFKVLCEKLDGNIIQDNGNKIILINCSINNRDQIDEDIIDFLESICDKSDKKLLTASCNENGVNVDIYTTEKLFFKDDNREKILKKINLLSTVSFKDNKLKVFDSIFDNIILLYNNPKIENHGLNSNYSFSDFITEDLINKCSIINVMD